MIKKNENRISRFRTKFGMTGRFGNGFGKTKLKALSRGVAAFLFLALASCSHIGLGPEVDQVAPEIEISSHVDNDVVPSQFTLSGKAYDNEVVTSITVDFDYQNLHYKVEPGKSWYKKTASSEGWVAVKNGEASCEKNGSVWLWSLYVNTSEGKGDGTTYELSACVTDSIGNTGKKSKTDMSLILDQNNPDVSIYKPELLTGSQEAVAEEAASYSLCDGNVIAKLLNGDLTFTGRQSGSISFKELRIEFDNGKLSSGTRKMTGDASGFTDADSIAEEVNFDGDEELTVYYSKTLKRGENGVSDLRNWEITVKQDEWVSESKNPELLSCGSEAGSAKLIRVVTTSLSDSLAWEKKVIGWFLWWPEADTPWVDAYTGSDSDKGENTTAVYPASNLSGTVHDDDGIKSFTYSVEKQGSDGKWSSSVAKTEIPLSTEEASFSAFSIKTPSVNGKYRIIFNVTDIYGKTGGKTKYIKILDVNPPKIKLTSPESDSSVLADKDGNITFAGTAGDDGNVSSLSLIYLNPEANDDSVNIIRYMSGSEAEWEKASATGSLSDEYSFTDSEKVEHKYKNKIYKLELGASSYNETEKLNTRAFSKKLNIFTDLGISRSNPMLTTQYFVLRALDNSGTTTVQQLSLAGDSESPSLEIKSIQQFDSQGKAKIAEFTFTENSVPTLAVVTNTDYAILKGSWSDNSVKAWNNNTSYMSASDISFKWQEAKFTITESKLNEDGSWNWTAKVTGLPKKSNPITASLTDLAGNTKTVSKSVFIESAELGLERLGAVNNDGAYSSGSIEITLDFTKNTMVTLDGDKKPYLVLNNGGKAYYTSGGEASAPKAQHIFKYEIAASDKDTKGLNKNGTLDVSKFEANGAIYSDASVSGGKEFEIELPTDTDTMLGTGRHIVIDKTAPKISSFKVISGEGWYKAEKQILFMVSFDESVSVTNAEKLGLTFDTIATPQNITSQASGSNILVTYTVSAGENSATALTLNGFTGTTGTDCVQVKDEAGNLLSDWSFTGSLDKNIYVDTSAPSAPGITKDWGTSKLVTSATGFTLSGTESGATVEYSLDGGSSYQVYKSKVELKNNGTYQIKARQTDKAGNVSPVIDGGSIMVEKGDFLTKITSDTPNGTYSVKKGGSVTGRLVFRKDITLPASSSVTLNAKASGATYKTCVLTKDSSATVAGGCDYTFTYSIVEGDSVASGELDVTGWSFSRVSYNTGDTSIGTIDFPLTFTSAVTSGKKLSDNKDIYIKTGNPSVSSAVFGGTVETDVTKADYGKVKNPTLTLTFDRPVSKGSGNILLELSYGDDDTARKDYADTFIAPAVIPASKYDSAFDTWYEAGLNGATKGINNKLTNDTTTKYVLKYDVDPTDSTLVQTFAAKEGWGKVTIPVVASAVSLDSERTSVTVDLSGTYKLPVMGAKYKLTVEAGAFNDDVQNLNAKYTSGTTGVTAKGVEPPVIRINKGKQTITSTGSTAAATVTMPSQAQMRIDCQTPGATIMWSKAEATSATANAITVEESGHYYDTKTHADNTIPAVNTTYGAYSAAQTLGDNITAYSGAQGKKFALAAYATKNSVNSSYAYEYATRTVLKFKIDGGKSENGKNYGYSGGNDGPANTTTSITEGVATLKFGDLRVWVTGGDSPYGGNSISPFPLDWHKSTGFRLMAGRFTNTTATRDTETMNSEWYWVSWDITTATYHGFVIGDVPSNASASGPTQWYSAEGAWDSQKKNYVLYPGETLIMLISRDHSYSNGTYRFRTKNHGQR